MSSQINFFLTPLDLSMLEQRLKKQCSVVFLGIPLEQPAPRLLSTLEVARYGEEWLKVFLAHPESLGALVFKHVPKQGYWLVDDDRSPVIELSRCFYDGKILRRGRVYYTKGFYDEAGQWVDKPADFLAWAKKVFSVTRKGLQRDAGLGSYVGQDAEEKRQKEGLQFVSL
jgi:hypothetical protein